MICNVWRKHEHSIILFLALRGHDDQDPGQGHHTEDQGHEVPVDNGENPRKASIETDRTYYNFLSLDPSYCT